VHVIRIAVAPGQLPHRMLLPYIHPHHTLHRKKIQPFLFFTGS
jgi:hypothetical protein